MINNIKSYVAKSRWIKKIIPRNYLPETCYVEINKKLKIFISPRDVAGPSFHLAYGKDVGFNNYEERNKKLIASHLKDGDVFFDVGANIGLFSLYLKRLYPDLKCYLFEPFPTLFNCLKLTLKNSKMEDVHINDYALCNENKELEFFIDTFNDGGHSLDSSSISSRSKKAQSLKIQGKKLDSFVAENNIDRIDFLKIDIQGAEVEFLKGARESINKFKPKIMVELNNKNLEDFINLIGEGYEIYCPGLDEKIDASKLNEIKDKLIRAGKDEEDYFFFPVDEE